MATTTHLASASEFIPRKLLRSSLLVRWHLLSLDAPTVAALWTWSLAAANNIRLPLSAILAMALAVWMLYAADRLLDARTIGLAPSHPDELEARHYFHHRNRPGFRAGILVASFALAAIAPTLAQQSIHLYLILGGLLLGYFILIHVSALQGIDSAARTYQLPKELAVGVFFSAAIFIPTVARAPSMRLILLPAAVLFAALCSLNCLFIYAWEHATPSPLTHPATRFALRYLPWLTIAATLSGLMLAVAFQPLPWRIPVACALAAALLLLLHGNRRRFDPTTLRAAADLCLLTPILLLPF